MQWQAVWSNLHAPRRPEPSLPEIDFTKYIVIVVASGTENSGGFEIEIVGAQVAGKKILIEVLSTAPGSDCIVTAGISAPVDIAVVPRQGLPLQFHERTDIRTCS